MNFEKKAYTRNYNLQNFLKESKNIKKKSNKYKKKNLHAVITNKANDILNGSIYESKNNKWKEKLKKEGNYVNVKDDNTFINLKDKTRTIPLYDHDNFNYSSFSKKNDLNKLLSLIDEVILDKEDKKKIKKKELKDRLDNNLNKIIFNNSSLDQNPNIAENEWTVASNIVENEWTVVGEKEKQKRIKKIRKVRIQINNKIMQAHDFRPLNHNMHLTNIGAGIQGQPIAKEASEVENKKRKLSTDAKENNKTSPAFSASTSKSKKTAEKKATQVNTINNSDETNSSNKGSLPRYSDRTIHKETETGKNKPATVVIKVTSNDLLSFLEPRPLKKLLEDFDSRFKISKYRVVYNRLFLEPVTKKDKENLLKDKDFFPECEKLSLESEGLTFLIFNVTQKEIHDSEAARTTLSDLGVVETAALDVKKPDMRAVKCVVKDLASIKSIMEDHYGHRKGIRFLINSNNTIVYGRVEPDGANPKQCFNCFSLGHFKQSCKSNRFCSNCASTHCETDKCLSEYIKCKVCSKQHASTDHNKCEAYKSTRRLLADGIVANITGKTDPSSTQANSFVNPLKTFARALNVDNEILTVTSQIEGVKKDIEAIKQDDTRPTLQTLIGMMSKVQESIDSNGLLLKQSKDTMVKAEATIKSANEAATTKCKKVKKLIKNYVNKKLMKQRNEYLVNIYWHDDRLKTIEATLNITAADAKKAQESLKNTEEMLTDEESDDDSEFDTSASSNDSSSDSNMEEEEETETIEAKHAANESTTKSKHHFQTLMTSHVQTSSANHEDDEDL
jgi:hypothetical protein